MLDFPSRLASLFISDTAAVEIVRCEVDFSVASDARSDTPPMTTLVAVTLICPVSTASVAVAFDFDSPRSDTAVVDAAGVVDLCSVLSGGGGVQGGRRQRAAELRAWRVVEGPLSALGSLQGEFLLL